MPTKQARSKSLSRGIPAARRSSVLPVTRESRIRLRYARWDLDRRRPLVASKPVLPRPKLSDFAKQNQILAAGNIGIDGQQARREPDRCTVLRDPAIKGQIFMIATAGDKERKFHPTLGGERKKSTAVAWRKNFEHLGTGCKSGHHRKVLRLKLHFAGLFAGTVAQEQHKQGKMGLVLHESPRPFNALMLPRTTLS